MMKKLILKSDGSKSYFKIYTLVFIVMAGLVCSWFIASGRSFIWESDGWTQHYTALVYYAKYLRSIIRGLLEQHQLIIPSWDFNIGEGSDILQTLHYYVIGDPFSFFSVLVPTRYMYLYYDCMILLRLYFAGITFSWFCFESGQKNKYGILAGAITYVFCYWALINIARHPYFLNPMIYLPLLLMGIERLLHRKRPTVFVIAVFLSGVSNFYFFYMLALLTIIYVLVRLFAILRTKQKKIKEVATIFGHIVCWTVVGCLLAAVILLPMIITFLNDTRMSAGNAYHVLYSLHYYSKLPALFLSANSEYWMCMGFAAPVLPATILLFQQKKKNRLLKVFMIICLLIMLVPFLGQVFNGFSYMSNRWCFAFAMLCAYIMSQMWPSLMELSRKELVVLVLGVMAYFAVCLLFDYSRQKNVYSEIVFALFFLFLLFPVGDGKGLFEYKRKMQMSLGVLFLSIFVNSFWAYAYGGNNYASESVETDDITDDLYTNESTAVKKAAKSDGVSDGFYRYSGQDLSHNAALRAGISSTQYYWTISNSYVNQFRKEVQIADEQIYLYDNYDDRSSLTTLASVLYYVIPESSSNVPYGFTYVDTVDVREESTEELLEALREELGVEELTEEQILVVTENESESYKVYRNDNALPLAYTYNIILDRDSYDTLSAVEKQEALLQAVVLEDCDLEMDSDLSLTSEKIPYDLTCNSSGVSLSDDGETFVVTSENASVTLTFEGLENSETYVCIQGLDFEGTTVYDLYFGEEDVDPLNLYNQTNWEELSASEKQSIRKEKIFWTEPTQTTLTIKTSTGKRKSIIYGTEDYSYYADLHNFSVNMYYSTEAVTEITITFSEVGIYSFESLDVICQPMDNYSEQVNALKEDTLDNMVIGTDSVSGTVDLTESKFLCFSIPYSTGWKAFVDGEEVELYRANTMYMAIYLDAGEHDIQLTYESPWLKEGICISSITALVILVVILIKKKRRKQGS